ncbi:MAG: dUTP diphosphatase [Actinomycetia bacterium]|nr:dUTP diphosphatase [Actinomycetes bacterium]
MEVLQLDSGLPTPAYAHVGDAGMDLHAAESCTIAPFQRMLIGTGIAVAVPEGHAGFVQPRSGLALDRGLSLVNTPGLIDSHYRGEIKVIAINLDPTVPIEIARGERIAQLIIQRVERVEPVVVARLDDTTRGEGGFGSTGV